MSFTCVAEFDDYPIHAERMIKQMDSFRKVNPLFKATLFAIPALMKEEHFRPIEDRKDWLRLGVHGIKHKKGECRRKHISYLKDSLKMIEGRPYDRICKAPHYGYGNRYIRLMYEAGYGFACRTSMDIYRWFGSNLDCPPVDIYAKYEQPHLRAFGHPQNVPMMFTRKVKRDNLASLNSALNFAYSSDEMFARKRIYLGSGGHRIEGFDHLDKHALSGIIPWEWGQSLPYRDYSISFVLIQQSLMYAPIDMYPEILKEINRVMCNGAVIVVKEDNASQYEWRPIGRSGVRSKSTPELMAQLLVEAGLTITNNDSLQLVDKYPSLINRQRKVANGDIYIVEATKQGGRR